MGFTASARLHRQPTDFAPLSPGGHAISIAPANLAWDRAQSGRLAGGGCLYGGQTATFWAPLRDLLHVTHGPVGCGVFALSNRHPGGEATGIDNFTGLNLSTDFQERDIVFGGENKLERAVTEAGELFPLHNGVTLFATCPVALIGDDLGAVAARRTQAQARPVVPVHCAGFRRADGVGETHATIMDTWTAWAEGGPPAPGPYDVALLCREMSGAWRGIVALLERIGLRVVARWPAGGSRRQTGRLGHGRLAIGINMEYWGRRLARQCGVPAIEADFLGPGATADSLRAIATRFDATIAARVDALIAAELPAAQAALAACRVRLAGRFYFSFSPLQPFEVRAYADAGIRCGSAQQGWPDRDGHWQPPLSSQRYQEMSPAQVDALLRRLRQQADDPDVLAGVGGDAALFRKRGYAVADERCTAALARAAIGFDGAARFAQTLSGLFDAPVRRLLRAPWA